MRRAQVLERAGDAAEAAMAPLKLLSRSFGQDAVLREVDHRPWPLPARRWFMAQTWEDLLFAHWPVPPEALRPYVPDAIPIDTFGGQAWLAITPFRVSAIRLRGMPHVPRVTAFLETNVRTYATIDDKPGIYFLSLDAASALAVRGARRSYRLPYFEARGSIGREGDWLTYRLERISADGPAAGLECRYRPTGDVYQPAPGSLEQWLTERYCLYTLDERQGIHRGDIHHPPWPLQRAEARIEVNTMAQPYGLQLPRDEALFHFSARQDVVTWAIDRIGGA